MDLDFMLTQFRASQQVLIPVRSEPLPIQHYLRQPRRLVNALVDPSRIDYLAPDKFRLKMRPLTLITITVQPTVDLQIWTAADGTVCLKSTGCKILGADYIDRRFSLTLAGVLHPQRLDEKTYLDGQADLTVQVELPPPLCFTPQSILDAAGNSLLKSVLLTIKQRLMHQLLADYQQWARAELYAEAPGHDLGLQGSQG